MGLFQGRAQKWGVCGFHGSGRGARPRRSGLRRAGGGCRSPLPASESRRTDPSRKRIRRFDARRDRSRRGGAPAPGRCLSPALAHLDRLARRAGATCQMKSLTLELNGGTVTHEVEPRETLADFLRERCRLTATHLGCEHAACGACPVAVDGQATRSCLRLAVMCDGRSVQTLEGLEGDPTMEVLRRHFHQSHAVQCGFCTPGMLMMARDILLRMPRPNAETVREQLSGQICRSAACSAMVTAIVAAAQELGGPAGQTT